MVPDEVVMRIGYLTVMTYKWSVQITVYVNLIVLLTAERSRHVYTFFLFDYILVLA